MDVRVVYGVVAGVLVLALAFLLWPRSGGVSPGVPGLSGVTVNFMGAPISLQPVAGDDLPCIGAPEGYTMVFYEHSSDDYGDYTTAGYAREGDHLSETLSWIRSRASACGFEKTEETSGAYGGARGTSMSFEGDGGEKHLDADVAVVTGSDGKTYTLLRLGLDVYIEEEAGGGEQTEQTEQGGTNTVVGPAAKYDKIFRPILKSVFGTPVTVQQADYISNTYHYDYILPRSIQESDTQALVDALEEEGFSLTPEGQQGEHVTLGFTRNSEWLQVDYDVGGNVVTIVYVVQG